METAQRFEPLPNAHHTVQTIDGVEWTVVRASKNWFVLPFLCFWLTGWTVGGGSAIFALLDGKTADRVFLSIWLVGWAFGWLFASSWILWQLGGRTLVAVTEGALIHQWLMPFISREKRYDATQVRNLRSGDGGGFFGRGFASMRQAPPFFPSMMGGSVKFDYGARTIQLLPGVDEAEGRMIAERLARNLPRTAAATA